MYDPILKSIQTITKHIEIKIKFLIYSSKDALKT